MKDTQEAVQHRLADVDARAARWLERVGAQLGRPGSGIERWARLSGYPTATAKFIAEQSADAADDVRQLLHDADEKHQEVHTMTEEERSQGGAVITQTLKAMGGTKEDAQRWVDALYDDDPAAEAVTAEGDHRRTVKLATGHQIVLEANGGFTFGQQYSPEVKRAITAYMADHPLAAEESQERIAALPTFDELRDRTLTVILADAPLIQDMPVPGEHRDAGAELADLMLEGMGIRTELPAPEELPIPSGPPSKAVTLELALGGLPVPSDAIRPALQLMAEPMRPSRRFQLPNVAKPSTEFAAGMPVPAGD
jgi:hypothetical protein